MSTLNILNVSQINGNTTYYQPTGTSAVVLLANPSGSSHTYKVDNIVASNISANTTNVTVSIYSNGSVAQGSAPSGGVAYPIINTVSIPANASLVVSDKTTTFYLMENQSIVVTSGVANTVAYIVSYEDLS